MYELEGLKKFRRALTDADIALCENLPEQTTDYPETDIEKRFGALLYEVDREINRLLWLNKYKE